MGPAVKVAGTKDSWEVSCVRCGKARWIFSRDEPVETYTCIRCRAALAGRNVVDGGPGLSQARRDALKSALRAKRSTQEPRSTTGEG